MKLKESFTIRPYTAALLGLTGAFCLFILGWFAGRVLIRPAIVTQRIAPTVPVLSVTESTVPATAPAVTIPPEPAYPIDVNQASAADLDFLPGIGPELAGRIVAYREENGPFSEPSDLMQVNGIGPARLEDILPYITIGETP